MSIFRHLDYREALEETALLWKKQRAGRSLQRLAEQSGLHTPYLSSTFKRRTHLNQDQLYSLCSSLSLPASEQTYLGLLLEWERSTVEERKEVLKTEIDKVRDEKFKSENHIKAKKIKEADAKYEKIYLNPEMYLTYFFLGLEKYQENPDLIARTLNLSPSTLKKYLEDLEGMNLIVQDKGKIRSGAKHFHLSQESSLCGPHQTLLNYMSTHQMTRLDKKDKYGFNVTFTANKKTKAAIQESFLNFVKEAEDLVRGTPKEDSNQVYQFNFQLFPWGL